MNLKGSEALHARGREEVSPDKEHGRTTGWKAGRLRTLTRGEGHGKDRRVQVVQSD